MRFEMFVLFIGIGLQGMGNDNKNGPCLKDLAGAVHMRQRNDERRSIDRELSEKMRLFIELVVFENIVVSVEACYPGSPISPERARSHITLTPHFNSLSAEEKQVIWQKIADLAS